MESLCEYEDAVCTAETGKAILVDVGLGENIWIPKSQIHDNSEVWKKGQAGKLVVTEWIAEQKGIL